MSKRRKYKIVTIGGGTGTFTVLSGLKRFPQFELSAIVNVTDSGGSTGRLRDEFGTLPVGDFRQALAALADEGGDDGTGLLRQLLLYRFAKGEKGLKGHNLGNLILTALVDLLGSDVKALKAASQIFRIRGEIVAVSKDDIDLVATYENGETVVGEKDIDEPAEGRDPKVKIVELSTTPVSRVNPYAVERIREADLIILGPGDLYSSTLSNVVIGGMPAALQKTKAKILYIVNLVTKWGQTTDMTAMDHIRELERYMGRGVDLALLNSAVLSAGLLELYAKKNEFPVADDVPKDAGFEVIRVDLLSGERIKQLKADKVERSLLRHDGGKIGRVVEGVVRAKL